MHFHSLVIADVRRETADAVSLAFTVPAALRAAFAFQCGQYLTLRAFVGGEEQRRAYSICSGMDEGELRIAVKRVAGGRFSEFAAEELKVGDAIDVAPPMGNFGVAPKPGAARRYAAFAAGSGITPILSIVKSVLAREPASHFSLFYGNRDTRSILFKDTLADLKDGAIGRLSVHHVLSREARDIGVLNGRLDGAKALALLRAAGPADRLDHIFLCGPAAMTTEITGALLQLGMEQKRVQTELFTPAEGGLGATRPASQPDAAQGDGAKLSLRIDGATHMITMRADETVLEAAQRQGLDMPWSCRAGMCCTCRARLVEGAVTMDQNYSLEAWEMQAGFVLTCQARPTSAVLTVDFDSV